MITEKFGRYTVIQTLGAGSMGTVYKAEDPDTGALVAVKHVRAQVLYDQSKRERFLREMLEVSMVSEPRINPILEIGDEDDDFYVVTPFLEGETVEGLLRKRTLSVREAITIAAETARALQALHDRGIAHRGVKPSNVWVGGRVPVILSDCAVSRYTELGHGTRHPHACVRAEAADTLIPLSALSYMSPEQVRGDAIDIRTDVFSLGVLTFEMISGHHPFEARNSVSRMSAILDADVPPMITRGEPIPPELERVVAKALSKRREDRQESAGQFVSDLSGVAESLVGGQLAAKEVPRHSWHQYGLRFWAAVALGVAALLAVFLFVTLRF